MATIIIALISLVGTLVGTFSGIAVGSKLISYRVEQLEKKVDEHNNFAKRLPVMEEQIKELFRRVNEK
ncbi:MAG: hypothetical protein KBT36_14845 [Kurthia sp.]|nr:hypothetical protein [Candidatus Kurthia equi]